MICDNFIQMINKEIFEDRQSQVFMATISDALVTTVDLDKDENCYTIGIDNEMTFVQLNVNSRQIGYQFKIPHSMLQKFYKSEEYRKFVMDKDDSIEPKMKYYAVLVMFFLDNYEDYKDSLNSPSR